MARLLTHPGDAIYYAANGLLEGNTPFHVAWLPPDTRDEYLTDLARRARVKDDRLTVFEGNAPARLEENAPLSALLAGSALLSGGVRRLGRRAHRAS